MNCESARNEWHRQVDGEALSTPAVEHLARCSSCREWAREMRQVVAALDALRDETESVVSNPAWSTSSRGSHWWATPLRVAAAVVFVAGLYNLYHRIGGTRHAGQENVVQMSGEPEATIEDPRLGVSLHGRSAAQYLAVTTRTDRPNVEMVWLYPVSATPPTRDRS